MVGKADRFDFGWNRSRVVIASKAKRSRLGVRRGGFVWIASLSLAMTVVVPPQPYRAAHGASIARRFDQRDVGTCECNAAPFIAVRRGAPSTTWKPLVSEVLRLSVAHVSRAAFGGRVVS
jgi:hypothetical protein